jgi:hypothetical protein
MPPEFDEHDLEQIRDTLDDMDQFSLPVTIHTSIGRVKVFPDGRAFHTTKQIWVCTGYEDEI